MKPFYKKATAVIIAIVLILSIAPVSFGQYNTPSYIRVGLYYKDSSVNTALSIFSVSAAAGIQAGYLLGNTFTEIYREASSSTLYARKDAYFYNSGDTLKEYSPSAASADSLANFAKYGPYHIKIGSDSPDQATAAAQVQAYRQAGIQAYIAYNDIWQVWTGSFPDEASVQAEIARITPMFGETGYSVIPPASNRIVLVNSQYQPLCIFGSSTAYFHLRPNPENNPPVISIKGKKYRGDLEVRRLAASDMTVINYVFVQEYLYGSVPAEIGGKSPAEAIKAQAIAAKMYAINNKSKHAKAGFDVCGTTDCQVYKGYSVEVSQCNAAIDQVKDYIITYDGKLAGAIYYFASSGGRTEDVRNVWSTTQSYPYLVSVEDHYEKIYSWTKTLRASDIKAKLPSLGNILGVSITQTAASGRVTQLSVRGDNSSNPNLYNRERCRTLFSLDSQLYTITTDADVYTAAYSGIPAAVALQKVPGTSGAPENSGSAVSNPDQSASMNREYGTSSVVQPLSATIDSSASIQPTAALVSSNPSAITKTIALSDMNSLQTTAQTQTIPTIPQNQTQTQDIPVIPQNQPLSQAQTQTQTVQAATSTTGQAIDATTGQMQVLPSGSTDAVSSNGNPITSATTDAPINANSADGSSSVSTPASLVLSVPMPLTASPVKSQLGGKQVATAGGTITLNTNNNKFTVLGANGALRSATLVPETYTFTGKGWGHAVGMSQEGAIGMGRAGISFDQILMHYFQGTKIEPQ